MLTEADRIEHIHVWAAKQNQENPGWKQKVQHKLKDKIQKYKKPRNIANLVYQAVMVPCPPGLSHAIDWGVGKGAQKAGDMHREKKAKDAAQKYAGLEEIDREGKELKHEIKKGAKDQFDKPAKRVREARDAFEKLLKNPAPKNEYCAHAKNAFRKFAYYKRRVRKLREAEIEMRELCDKLRDWIKLNEDYIDATDGGYSAPVPQTMLEKFALQMTDHNYFCHDTKCVNWSDEAKAAEILDHYPKMVHGAPNRQGFHKL